MTLTSGIVPKCPFCNIIDETINCRCPSPFNGVPSQPSCVVQAVWQKYVAQKGISCSCTLTVHAVQRLLLATPFAVYIVERNSIPTHTCPTGRNSWTGLSKQKARANGDKSNLSLLSP
jgi:hypothetical protein